MDTFRTRPDGVFAYVTGNTSDTVTTLKIDPASNSLSELATTSLHAGSHPTAIAADPLGHEVAIALNANSENLVGFQISTDGFLGSPTYVSTAVLENPTALIVMPFDPPILGVISYTGSVTNLETYRFSGGVLSSAGPSASESGSAQSLAFVNGKIIFSTAVGAYIDTVDSAGILGPTPTSYASSLLAMAVHPSASRIYGIPSTATTVQVLLHSSTGTVDSSLSTGSGTADLAVDPKGERLFVATVGSLEVFSLDPTNGALSNAGIAAQTVTIGSDPKHVAVDASGRFLLVTDCSANQVRAFSIGPDGLLSELSNSPLTLSGSTCPYGIAVSDRS